MKHFNSKNYRWSLEGLINCIEENKLISEILFYTETGAIVHVKSYEDSVILGAESDWCISQHRESWHKYVEKDNCIQLFFYNFEKKVEEDDSLVGVTFNDQGKVVCGFTRPNYPIGELCNKKYKTDENALIKHIIDKNFDGIIDELRETIKAIHIETYKKKEEVKKETHKEIKPAYTIHFGPSCYYDWY